MLLLSCVYSAETQL